IFVLLKEFYILRARYHNRFPSNEWNILSFGIQRFLIHCSHLLHSLQFHSVAAGTVVNGYNKSRQTVEFIGSFLNWNVRCKPGSPAPAGKLTCCFLSIKLTHLFFFGTDFPVYSAVLSYFIPFISDLSNQKGLVGRITFFHFIRN